MRVGGGTLILTENGWKPVCRLCSTEQLWDGKRFTDHEGLTSPTLEFGAKSSGVFVCTGKSKKVYPFTENNITRMFAPLNLLAKEVRYEGLAAQMDPSTCLLRDQPNALLMGAHGQCYGVFTPFFTVLTTEGPAVLPGEGEPCL